MIFYTFDAVPDVLGLPTSDHVSPVYLGWRVDAAHVDGGPSEQIARVLAAALCQQYHAIFLCGLADQASRQWQRHFGYSAQKQTRALKQSLPLIWTNEPVLVMQAFDADWTTQGQFILLSKSPTPVDFDAFDLQGKPAAILEFIQRSADFCGAMVPGVDGDFAGLYVQNAGMRNHFIEQDLRGACGLAQMPLEQRSGAGFLV